MDNSRTCETYCARISCIWLTFRQYFMCFVFLNPVQEIPIAFNYAAATAKQFEAEYDFKRPPKKEKDRNKTIVFVADSPGDDVNDQLEYEV